MFTVASFGVLGAGSQILAGDQNVYMPAYDVDGALVAPEVEGVILRSSDDIWKIITSKPLNPAGDPILYTLQVRQ